MVYKEEMIFEFLTIKNINRYFTHTKNDKHMKEILTTSLIKGMKMNNFFKIEFDKV